MRLSKSVSLLLVATAASVKAQAQAPSTARFSSCCGLLLNKIYCYGGSYGTRDEEIPDSTMFMLDISKANGANMTELENNWKPVIPNTAGINNQRRENSQCEAIEGTRLVLSGGYGGTDVAMVDQTIVYNAEDNTWKKYANYMEGTFGNRQIYYAATAVVPSKGLAFYGGWEDYKNTKWTIATNQNLTATEFNSGASRYIGYTGVTYLDINNANSPWSTPSQTNAPSVFSALQTSVFDPISKKIFYFGGTYEDTFYPGYKAGVTEIWHSMAYALTFDTVSGAWGNQTLNGDTIPTMRDSHTTTFLPNGESTVLLYGGEKNDVVSSDYCYTLDLKSFTWTQQNIEAPFVDLFRSRHNAILANKDTLFIVNGIDAISKVTSLPIVLNISNPSSITYVQKYTDPNVSLESSRDQPYEYDSSEGLSTGAVAGISVGAAIVGILALASIIFCLRKKRAKQNKKDQGEDEHNKHMTDTKHETIEVNWDEIDKQYQEVPISKLTASYPSPPVAPSLITKYEDESSTSSGTAVHYKNVSPLSHNTIVSHPPHTIDEVSHQPLILKPDGANVS